MGAGDSVVNNVNVVQVLTKIKVSWRRKTVHKQIVKERK